MKYVLLFCGTQADQHTFDAMSPEELQARYAEVGRWFQTNGPKILESQQLQGPQTATTVRFDHAGQPAITDGPFIESNEMTVAQRIVRARRKITQAQIPYRMPNPDELHERLAGVLAVLYLLFNEGYLAGSEGAPVRRDVAEEAAWLADLVVRLFPREPEPMGLLVLMRLHLARGATRFDTAGDLVLLPDQDRARWNRASIEEAIRLLERAATFGRPGPYQLQAAIVACHAEAASWAATDWPQIVILYDMLLGVAPSPVVRLNRAIALCQVAGPAGALADIQPLARALDAYHLFHATRARLLADTGQMVEAREAEQRALALTHNRAEQSFLRRRLAGLEPQ